MTSWATIALVLTLGGTAFGQTNEGAYAPTIDEARKQMILHTGRFRPPEPVPVPAPETVHAPNLLLDPAGMERDFEEGRRRRNGGIALTVVGITLETVAVYLALTGLMMEAFEPLGESVCDALTSLNGGSASCRSGDEEAQTFFRLALITGLVGAPFLGSGISDWVAGKRQMRKARGYSVSIVPAAGSGFAGLGATLAF